VRVQRANLLELCFDIVGNKVNALAALADLEALLGDLEGKLLGCKLLVQCVLVCEQVAGLGENLVNGRLQQGGAVLDFIKAQRDLVLHITLRLGKRVGRGASLVKGIGAHGLGVCMV
jgi:hypothetical protein